jgi:hypothetical protein
MRSSQSLFTTKSNKNIYLPLYNFQKGAASTITDANNAQFTKPPPTSIEIKLFLGAL